MKTKKRTVHLGIAARLVLTVGGVVAVAIAAITVVIALRMRAVLIQEGMDRGAEAAARWSLSVGASLNETFDAARTLATTMEAWARGDTPDKRATADETLRHFIESRPELMDTYVVFEPDAFDGDDASWVGTQGSDATGRFLSLWSRDERGQGVLEANAGYDVPGTGDYYLLPKQRNRETILDPYVYPIQGVDTLMTSLVAPIRDTGGKFIGITGIDVPLTSLQELAASIRVDGLPGAYVNIYAANGAIAANRNQEAVGQNVKDYYKGFDGMIDAVIEGRDTVVSRYSTTAGSIVHTFLHGTEIGRTGTRWIVGVSIPEHELTEQARRSTVLVAAIGAAALVLLLLIVILYSRTLSRPIALVTQGASLLAEGDTQLTGMDTARFARILRRGDELGAIGKAFQALIDYLQQKVVVAQRIAEKDLTVEVNVSSDRDTLGSALREMSGSLNGFLGQVSQAAEQVSSGGSQVSSASQSLSQGATEQASSIEEISASVTQISGQTRQNAQSAAEANTLSRKVMESAERGNQRMSELVTAMDKITTSSGEIRKVVKAIDDIAFQINLLALNANVEAARAGKYGKGFAVVADEVRNLAVRSAQSVRETTEMVDASLKSTEEGGALVSTTATQLGEIAQVARKSADLVEEIAAASREQALALEQITTGLTQIDEVTQSNTASAEESASASEELSSQATELRGLVGQFRLNGGRAAAVEVTAFEPGAGRVPVGAASGPTNGHANGKTRVHLDDTQFGRF